MEPIPFHNLDDWFDLAGYMWVGVVAILVAAIPAYYSNRRLLRIESQNKDIRDQVVNGHTETNLRNDLDKVVSAVETLSQDVADISHDVRALRSDLMAEEDRRRMQIGDLRDELEHRTGKRRHP